MKKYFYLYVSSIIAAFGGFLVGFDTGVISGALLFIKQSFQVNSMTLGMSVSAISFGAVIGAFINGFFIDKIGRKKMLILVAIIFLLGSLFCCFSQNIYKLIISRTFLGFAVGIVSFAGPLYLSEISFKEKRGQMVSLYQLAITFGILFSYLINFFCADFQYNWRLMFLFGAIPSFLLLISIFYLSDSPRWLVLKGDIDKAKNILAKLNPKMDTNCQIDEIKDTLKVQNNTFKLSKAIIKPFIIGIGIMFCQIATGINAIIYYAPSIFKQVGFEFNNDALYVTIFIGLINFLMTFVAIYFIDRLGRKPLLYIGLTGMLIGMIGLGVSYFSIFYLFKIIPILSTALYIVSFSISLGPIALLLISEIFPLKYRGFAMSSAIVANFIFNFIVTGIFPIALEKVGGAITFGIFALIIVFAFIFVYFIVPETKNRSLEEIEKTIHQI